MWSTNSKDRSSLSNVPSLPAIDTGYHRNGPTSPTPHQGNSLEERMMNLELSNKALLEEMMHVHAAVRRERELSSKSLTDTVQETDQRLSHTQALWESSSEELASQNRRMADRLARLESAVSGMGGAVSRVSAEKEKEGAWLKETFSDVHEHVSWLTKKMEVTVAGLGNSLKRLEDSTAVKHGQLVTMVTSAIENKQATLEERVHLLEKVLTEDQKSLSGSISRVKDDLSASIEQVKEEMNNLNESLSIDRKKHNAQFGSLKESVSRVAKESTTNHQELSTVLKAEIKTRLKVFNDVRGQCLQVQELCRGSVQALREGLLSLEERMAAVRKENHTRHEQVMMYCQEIDQRMHADLDLQLTSLHQQLTTRPPPPAAPSGTFLTTINEAPDNAHIDARQGDVPVINQNTASELLSGVTIEQSKQLLDQSKELLGQSRELGSRQELSKGVLEQLQSNLGQSENLLEQSKQLQSNLEKAQQVLFQVHTRSHIDHSRQALSQVQLKLDQSNEVFDRVQTTLHQSEEVLDRLKSQLDQTHEASNQMLSNLNHSRQILDLLRSTLAQSNQMLEEVNSNLNTMESYSSEGQESLLRETSQNRMYPGDDVTVAIDTEPHTNHTNETSSQLPIDESQASTEVETEGLYSHTELEQDPEPDESQLADVYSDSEDGVNDYKQAEGLSDSEPDNEISDSEHLNDRHSEIEPPDEVVPLSMPQPSRPVDSTPATPLSNEGGRN